MKLILVLSILMITAWFPAEAIASPFKKTIPISWDPVPGAFAYDIEVKSIDTNEVILLLEKITQPNCEIQVGPGKYELRSRSRDKRTNNGVLGVPGAWGPPQEFTIDLDELVMKSPNIDEKIQSKSAEEEDVTFEWEHPGGADGYQLDITSGKEAVYSKLVQDTKLKITLPVAAQYSWKVKAVTNTGMSTKEVEGKLTIIGKKLANPEIGSLENEPWVRQVKWKNPDKFNTVDYELQRINPRNPKGKPISVAKETGVATDTLNIPTKDLQNYPGGRYRLIVQAHGNLRPSSDKVALTFNLKHGDRSPAAEEQATTKESIDRIRNWYFMANWKLTIMNYTGSPNRDIELKLQAIGGTGTIGFGWMAPNPSWGAMMAVDYSGFNIDGKFYTFAATEISGIYRSILSYKFEFRSYLGMFFKELPELKGTAVDAYTGTQKVGFSGPHLGAELWYAYNRTIGLQTHFHIYQATTGVSVPEGGTLTPATSYQFGGLFSFRIKQFPGSTFLGGYVYRADEAKFLRPGASSDSTIKIIGQYINFLFEKQL